MHVYVCVYTCTCKHVCVSIAHALSLSLFVLWFYSQHYEGYAFMRDEDMVGPLQQLLGGLSLINFNM